MGVACDEMALNNSGKLNLFSLTGYLNLYQKSLFKGTYKQYWFWFDEKSCCLKFYRSQQTYLQNVNDPVGKIDLRYAKVTPGIAGGTSGSHTFNISVNNQNYVLAAKDANSALNWIEKLQEKRGEYIKVSSAMQETASEQDRGRLTLQPWTTPVGPLAEHSHERLRESKSISPPTVRKIVNSQLIGGDSRHMTLDMLSSPNYPKERRSTVDGTLNLTSSPAGEKAESKILSEPQLEEEEDELPSVLNPEERMQLELKMSALEAQSEVSTLQKEVRSLNEDLKERDDEVEKLQREVASLREELAKRETPASDLRSENDSLKNIIDQYKRSLKTFDDEIELHKLNQKEHERRIAIEKVKGQELERELSNTKAKYVKLLSDKFKIAVPSVGARGSQEIDNDDVKYKNELIALMKQEVGENPEFLGYVGTFVDQFGDYHDWQGDTITQHYLCRHLYLHYKQHDFESHDKEWSDFVGQAKRVRNKSYLDISGNERVKKRDLRDMIRRGVPIQHRTIVWTSLIYHHCGKLKDIRDAACGDISYYQSLVKCKASKPAVKQIKLDLYRTLPNNCHFKPGGSGAEKLERVLLAYSLHNKNVGYCQGMNMIAAIGLLFLDEETNFWFMVTLIEKLLPPNYFTPGLIAAQADQAVVRDLVADKLPRLNAHLKEHFIDVTLVTFNWFLTLFVDALPTDSVLRILDCFLMEGHKLLFRVSLGILKLNEGVILGKTDPVTIFQFLKEIARHCFDIDAVFHEAFDVIVPFPNRSNLSSRHNHHLSKVKQQLVAREKERKVKTEKAVEAKNAVQNQLLLSTTLVPPAEETVLRYVWECGCVGREGELWLCSGERQRGSVGIITIKGGAPQLDILPDKVSPRVICCHYVPSCQLVLLGTLDFVIQAIDCETKKEIWSLKMKDSVLDITGNDEGFVYVALADGSVAVLQDVGKSPPLLDPALQYVGSTPVPCIALTTNKTLWCGCNKVVVVMSTESFEPVHSLVISSEGTSTVYKMKQGPQGVWISFRSSSVVCLFDVVHYVKLLQINYSTLLPSQPSNLESINRITSLMVEGDHLWIGTGSGAIHIFSVHANVSNPIARIRQLAKQGHKSSDHDANSDSGGLLGQVVGDDHEQLETSSQVTQEQGSATPDLSGRRYYETRRKTRFGRTLHREKPSRSTLSSAVYKLSLETSQQAGNARNESVRIILPISCGDDETESYAVSCSNAISDWNKSMQVWHCDSIAPPSQWRIDWFTGAATVPPSAQSTPNKT